jgi:undecaprenyl-diphosphatase
MDPIHGLDWGTYYFFTTLRKNLKLDLEPVMVAGMELGGWLVLGSVALLVFILLCRRYPRQSPLAFLLVTVLAVGLDLGLKRLVQRKPPDETLWSSQGQLPYSFPSRSALLASFLFFVLAMSLAATASGRAARLRSYGACTGIVLFIGTSQLYLGVHFVTDLLAGWTAGVLLGLLFVSLAQPGAATSKQ